MNMHAQQRGFTLIELMVTIAILAILTAIAYPSYSSYMQRQRIEKARAHMTKIIHHAEKVYASRGSFCENASGACAFSASEINQLQEADSRYNVVARVQANQFILEATPKSGVYSQPTLDNNHLNILYDSTTANFARCNTDGFAYAKSNSAASDPGNNCEVF